MLIGCYGVTCFQWNALSVRWSLIASQRRAQLRSVSNAYTLTASFIVNTAFSFLIDFCRRALFRELRLRARASGHGGRTSRGRTSISNIEIGERGGDFLLVRDLCGIYEVSMTDFIDEFEERVRQNAKRPRVKRVDRKRE